MHNIKQLRIAIRENKAGRPPSGGKISRKIADCMKKPRPEGRGKLQI